MPGAGRSQSWFPVASNRRRYHSVLKTKRSPAGVIAGERENSNRFSGNDRPASFGSYPSSRSATGSPAIRAGDDRAAGIVQNAESGVGATEHETGPAERLRVHHGVIGFDRQIRVEAVPAVRPAANVPASVHTPHSAREKETPVRRPDDGRHVALIPARNVGRDHRPGRGPNLDAFLIPVSDRDPSGENAIPQGRFPPPASLRIKFMAESWSRHRPSTEVAAKRPSAEKAR